jgi:hypothetical protein
MSNVRYRIDNTRMYPEADENHPAKQLCNAVLNFRNNKKGVCIKILEEPLTENDEILYLPGRKMFFVKVLL